MCLILYAKHEIDTSNGNCLRNKFSEIILFGYSRYLNDLWKMYLNYINLYEQA